MGEYFTIGEFANRAGVTVRTIRYYDQIGLLAPSAYSEAGRRLYTALDYARLQQILTLKLIGLSLADIRQLLTTDVQQVGHLLQQQKSVLQAQAQQLARLIATIDRAQQALEAHGTFDLQTFIDIISEVNQMTQGHRGLDQFMTADQQAQLAEISTTPSLNQQKAIGEAWKTLFEDVQNSLNRDLHDPAVQQLVDRWDALVAQAGQGAPDLADPLTQAYTHLTAVADGDAAPPALRAWLQGMQTAADFIQRARAARP